MNSKTKSIKLDLENKTVLITGATGLIGSALVKYILNNYKNSKVIALIRNIKKADEKFRCYSPGRIHYLLNIDDLAASLLKIDLIIHAASQTSSNKFVTNPVETILDNIFLTHKILELAKNNKICSMIYLSTMEVYGNPLSEDKIFENSSTSLLTTMIRSSYPESKRLCECLCVSYFKEYNVPVKIIRLTQTFGPGVDYNDNRVFAQFARSVIEKKDIVLKTKGETKRNYLYIDDAISAILIVLLFGENGEAYNAANEETYCSIMDMANLVINTFAPKQKIIVDEENTEKYGYASTLKMNLDTSKLKSLGWYPNTGLKDAFKFMIEDMRHKWQK